MTILKPNSKIIQGKTRELTCNELTKILRALEMEKISWYSNLIGITINISRLEGGNIRFWRGLDE